MKEIFHNVFRDGNQLYTKNLVPVKRVYGERLVDGKNDAEGVVQFREWDPRRSKLGAAIMNGLQNLGIDEGSVVLYLGASTGTTVSHVSDIIGASGLVYGIEFAERVLRNLLDLSKERKNVAPIKADARKIDEYNWAEECDLVFCDIADPQQTDIAIRNAKEFLKKSGMLMISVKSQSIDVTKKPKEIFELEKKKVENAGFRVVQLIDLEPYEEKHAMIVAMK
jgi:fibrillarin-like pre-rRNA processing protein